ncbi:FAD-dependent monooxygenase [Corynebacterium comes]|uniref:Pentachlorophenol 4-monooxygenase n=1 Tax=Corynebacterium comes TaxID=2675218 RepID=A0A6B8VXN6_9CORY|nr:FAD-dependent monooxygenase [Corynebacterium comes]QGU03476.1 Pentachlorophenol 4-monooxygenase [Corynebacterium comes]
MTDVIVVGGGPTGMMLAGELALAGVDVTVGERRTTSELAGSRAGGFHSRTIEILDQRGIAERFLAEGQTAQTARFGTSVVDISDFPTRHPYGLALWQSRIEPILADWIEQLGVRVERGREVTGFVQDGGGVDVAFRDGGTKRASWLIGADGGRSVIRKAAGIEFPGWEATRSNLIAEVEVTQEPPPGFRQDESGIHAFHLMPDGRTYRVVTTERQLGPATEPTMTDLSNALASVYGTDFGVHNPTWLSRFTDATRQAAAYRNGRVLLAGDAAHIHYPAGGQGIGLGIQDAVNLGWKLAQVLKGVSPPSLLDTYQAERHPAGARALRLSMAQTALQRGDPRTAALNDILGDLLLTAPARTQIGALIHGLDVAYDLGGGHPLLGRRMPDLDIVTSAGSTRVYALLYEARPVLIDFAGPRRIDASSWADRVRAVDAEFRGVWELPVLGEVAPPTAVLVRPDGHVAWVEDGAEEPLGDALRNWFGPGTRPARSAPGGG